MKCEVVKLAHFDSEYISVAGFCAKIFDLIPQKEHFFTVKIQEMFRSGAVDVILEITKAEKRRREQQFFSRGRN
jgi:hypothetical protein